MESAVVMIVTMALFFAVPAILCVRGWFIRAGLAMLTIELLPIVWQVIRFPDSDAPGFGMLAVFLSPFSFTVLAVGIVVFAFRGVTKLWRWSRG